MVNFACNRTGINCLRLYLFFKLLKMKKLHVLAVVALILFTLSGCEKQKITNQASVDVFVKAIKNSSGTTVYTALHSVFSYNIMTAVSVKSPDGTTTQLTNYENAGNSFYNEPATTDYTSTAPSAGTYTYTVTFNDGEQITYTNSLLATSLQPAVITGLTKNTGGDSIYITWNAIAGTQAYQLKVSNGTKQVYYQAAFADGSTPLKASLRLGYSLSTIFTNGAGVYTFEIDGLLFESTSSADYLQAISLSSKDITL
jgi:hypothetical protein